MSFFTEGLFHNASAPRARAQISLNRVGARLKAIARTLTRRKQIEALSRLDDRMLSDIGVTRADLHAASRWSLWGDPGDRLTAAAQERREARERAAAACKGRTI